MKSAADALKKIAAANVLFISRGDNSGTHAKEKKLWKQANITPAAKNGIRKRVWAWGRR